MNTSKKLWLFTAVIILTSCGGSQQGAPMNLVSDPVQSLDSVSNADSVTGEIMADSLKSTAIEEQYADAVTSATAIANVSTFNGTLVIPPQNHATVTISMAGTVRNTTVLPGAYVKRGTVLATIENPEFIVLQQAFLDSHAQTEFLDKEYQRQQSLVQGEAASQKKLQQSKADYLSMKSRHDAAAAQLSLLGVSATSLLTGGIIPLLEVKAPISGYVANVKLNLGKHIAVGESLCEIIDKSKTMLCLTAYEKDLAKIKVGDKVEFRVNGMGKKSFKAVLVSVGQQVDRNNRSLEVYANVVEGDAQFRPGMYITARVARN